MKAYQNLIRIRWMRFSQLTRSEDLTITNDYGTVPGINTRTSSTLTFVPSKLASVTNATDSEALKIECWGYNFYQEGVTYKSDQRVRNYPRHNGWPNGCSFLCSSIRHIRVRSSIVLMIVMKLNSTSHADKMYFFTDYQFEAS